MNSGYIYMEINKKLVKNEKIKIELIDISFKIFNADRTKNGEATIFAPLEVEVNRYKKKINIAVIDLNRMDIFLGYD